MTHEISFSPEAELDLDDACSWYERRSEGLGDDFLISVGEAFERIRRHPESCAVIHDEARRAQVARFPYGIIYLVEQDAIVVIGVIHNSRDPNQWLSRL